MTLLERVRAAGNGVGTTVVRDHDTLLGQLKRQVEKTVSADVIASIMAENPVSYTHLRESLRRGSALFRRRSRRHRKGALSGRR